MVMVPLTEMGEMGELGVKGELGEIGEMGDKQSELCWGGTRSSNLGILSLIYLLDIQMEI